jgi:hypothetical protein
MARRERGFFGKLFHPIETVENAVENVVDRVRGIFRPVPSEREVERQRQERERLEREEEERRRRQRPPPGGGPPITHTTWRDLTRLAEDNIRDGQWYSSKARNTPESREDSWRYEYIREALDELKSRNQLIDRNLSDREAAGMARDQYREILEWQLRAFDAYAIDLDPGPGRALRAHVAELGLNQHTGDYHGNTATGSSHFYGNRGVLK